MRISLWTSLVFALLFAMPAMAEGDSVAADGLDPVLLIEGERTPGNASITLEQDGFVYRFASKKTRKRFQKNPERYSYQDKGACAVMPSARAKGDLYLVHEGKLYGFGSTGCKAEFEDHPEEFVAQDKDQDGND